MANESGGKIIWTLDVEKSAFVAGLAQAVTLAKGAASVLGSINLGDNFKTAINDVNNLGSAVTRTAGLSAAAGGLLGGVFLKSAGDIQTTSASFGVLIGNQTVSNELFGQLLQYANATPFQFPQIAKGAQTLLGFGVQAKDITTVIRQMGDVAGATGGSFDGLALVTGQVFAQGKLRAQDFYQIINSGAGALAPLIAKNLGVDGVGALVKEFDKGDVSASAFFAALQQATAQGGFAFQGADKLAQTFSGRLSTLKDTVLEFGRNLLGVKVDPQLGLVVQPGGVFDQLSNLLPKISAAAGALGPQLANGFTFIIANGPTIIGVIAGIAAGFLAFRALGAIFTVITALANPVTLVLTAIGIVLGVVVFGAVQKLIPKVRELFATFGQSVGGIKAAANQDLPPVKEQIKAVDDQATKLGKSILQANQDFKESLAQIVKSHEDALNSLKRQTADENATFDQAQKDKADSFDQSQEDMKRTHDQRTTDIQKQLDDELKKGRLADRSKISDLRDRLQQETDDYNRSVEDKQATYDKDTANALKQHQTKLDDLQKQLDAETLFQQKHVVDLRGIRASDALDEVDKLKQTHDRQIASFNDQFAQIATSGTGAATTIKDQINAIPSQIDIKGFAKTAGDIGKQMATNIGQAILGSIGDVAKAIDEFLLKTFLNVTGIGGLINDARNIGKALHIPGFAGGVTGFAGGWAVVGEQGPELVNLPTGSSVLSNQDSRQAVGSGGPVNIVLNLSGVMARSRGDLREIGKDLIEAVNEEMRSRRLPEIGGGSLNGVAR